MRAVPFTLFRVTEILLSQTLACRKDRFMNSRPIHCSLNLKVASCVQEKPHREQPWAEMGRGVQLLWLTLVLALSLALLHGASAGVVDNEEGYQVAAERRGACRGMDGEQEARRSNFGVFAEYFTNYVAPSKSATPSQSRTPSATPSRSASRTPTPRSRSPTPSRSRSPTNSSSLIFFHRSSPFRHDCLPSHS